MWGRIYGTIFGHESSDDEEDSVIAEVE